MRKNIPIALQLYSVRDDCSERGLAAILKEVAAMGYQGVEFAGFHGLDASELKTELDANGLKVAGAHIPLEDLLGDRLSSTIEYNKTIGNRFLICPILPEEHRNSIASWRKSAALFNELATKLAAHGMSIGYHNHTLEFVELDGILPWDVFYGNTGSDVVMQLDTGNALAAGADVAPFIEKYPNRSVTVHLKEHAHDVEKQPLIGQGDVDWQRIFRLCEETGGTEWYIVEQESSAYPPMECVRHCLDNLRRMLQNGTLPS